VVTNQQFFNVFLHVSDSTEFIQITPNTCPAGGISTATVESATVANSEDILTGNLAPPYGPGSIPNYPQFLGNGNSTVEWSLLPFQTTGHGITGCFDPSVACSSGSNTNSPVLLPPGIPSVAPTVTVNPQSLADYNACVLPSGFAGLTPITGASVPGIGSLTQTGPISATTFIPAANVAAGAKVTIYSCRPTVAPAWLNSPLYPGNNLGFPGGPEPWANCNGPFGVAANNSSIPVAVAPVLLDAGSVAVAAAASRGPVPTVSGLTCPLLAGPGPGPGGNGPTSRLGLFRPSSQFFEDVNAQNTLVFPGFSGKYIPSFFTLTAVTIPVANGGNGVPTLYQPAVGDIGVAGDWTGDGKSKVGVFRASTGQWFLDVNNDGAFDAGDSIALFGQAGDIPVVGNWSGAANGKQCVGVFRSGFFWVLDLNCNGVFDGTGAGQDTAFPFGGISGDMPVVGNFFGTAQTTVGVVRKYAPGGVPIGNPFFWVLDGGTPSSAMTPAAHQPAAGAFPYGGVAGDVFITGDWTGSGISRAGVYRSGNWILDLNGAHTYDTFYQFGGAPGDVPTPGKW
jgi:hypothetical protein